MSFKDITAEDYSPKSFVVRVNSLSEIKDNHKNALKEFGGKWNTHLRGGAGWIFPNSKRNELDKYINEGKITSDSSPQVDDVLEKIEKILKSHGELLQQILQTLQEADEPEPPKSVRLLKRG